MSNSSTEAVVLDDADDYDYEYFPLVKLLSSLVDVIWEQSEQTSIINTTPWNRLGAVSKYCCSIYGLACLIMALHDVPYKVHEHHLQELEYDQFRIGVIALFAYQLYNILVVLNLHYHLGLTAGSTLNWLYRLIPDKFFGYDTDSFNGTKYMKTPSAQVMIGPTSDMYWPIFLTFCLLSFIETFIASIQGKKPYTESGITIFEHSLAFQEFSSNGAFFFGSSKYFKRPTEQVLLTTMFLILNHLNIHIGAILNDNKYRLIPLSILGMTFLGYFLSFFFLHESGNDGAEEDEPSSIIKNLNIDLNDDFYTALLNIGLWPSRWLEDRAILQNSVTESSGYGNIIKNPPQRLISGSPFGEFDGGFKDGRISVFRRRFLYLKEMIVYTYQLLYGLVIDVFVCEYLPNAFRRVVLRKEVKAQTPHGEETQAEYEKRKSRAPPFLRRYVKRRVPVEPETREVLEIDSLTVEEIPDTYAGLLLSANDISEVDTSRDYQVEEEEELESENESEIEIIFERQGVSLG
ncbi:hypothetical protein Cantr_10263 [Candida viswanathii]|uniref:Uncharacterized protein n=1 Tax=Candida viswanathii TaxID=5486 RepID=A0A367YBF3_9ASCO|nr:hypothetical protein Cantr_10263 [Candida viswanathii]